MTTPEQDGGGAGKAPRLRPASKAVQRGPYDRAGPSGSQGPGPPLASRGQNGTERRGLLGSLVETGRSTLERARGMVSLGEGRERRRG